MKQFLQYVKENDVIKLLEKVDDYYEYCNPTDISKSLKTKVLMMSRLENKTGLNLVEFFKEKLIFKMFNECDWNEDTIIAKHNKDSMQSVILNLSKSFNLNVKHKEES